MNDTTYVERLILGFCGLCALALIIMLFIL